MKAEKQTINVLKFIKKYNEENPKNKLNQTTLADLVGCDKQTFTVWKTNESKTAVLLKKISNILGCTVDDLINSGNES